MVRELQESADAEWHADGDSVIAVPPPDGPVEMAFAQQHRAL